MDRRRQDGRVLPRDQRRGRLRRAIAAAVRRHRPDIVITNNFRTTWDGATALNQADHIAAGRATLDAVRDAGNRWVFAEEFLEGVTRPAGARLGTRYAVPFEVFHLGLTVDD